MEDIKTYEMLIEDENIDGVYSISLVDSPAILQDFILLSKENKDKIEIKLEKGDLLRHVLSGPALIPNIIIPRKGYNITFSKDTIRKISENFLIQNNKDRVDIQHSLNVNEVYLIESWIVEDEKNDKIYTLGYTPEQVPQGSWCVSFKVKNNELWQEYLSSGILKGFSISGNFSEKEIKLDECIECAAYPWDKCIADRKKDGYSQASAEKICGYIRSKNMSVEDAIQLLINEGDLELDDENNNIHLKDIFLALYYTEEDLDQQYKWKLGPETAERKNCPACKAHAGKIKTLREWINTAIPATPNGTVVAGLTTQYPTDPYGTYCEQHCGCELVKVLTTKRGATIIKPW